MPDALRAELDKVCKILTGPHGGDVWSILTAMRGPDSPSERPNMTSEEAAAAYKGRRERKFRTVEILRAVALPGATPGARTHLDTKVTLPPENEWDHFDKHVARAAGPLGLKVEIMEPKHVTGEVKVVKTDPAKQLLTRVKELLGDSFDESKFSNRAADGKPSTIEVIRPLKRTDATKLRQALNALNVLVTFLPNPAKPEPPDWQIKVVMSHYSIPAEHAKELLDADCPFPAVVQKKLDMDEPPKPKVAATKKKTLTEVIKETPPEKVDFPDLTPITKKVYFDGTLLGEHPPTMSKWWK